MDQNRLPAIDLTDNPTGCCPRFHPEGWDGQDLHFRDKLFVKAVTRSVFHVPVNMGPVFSRTLKAIDEAKALEEGQYIALSHEISPWSAEHFFAVKHDVPGEEMVRLSGNYRTRVFEGAFKQVREWNKEMAAEVEASGHKPGTMYFFYTTCPSCAKAYGKNYVVAVAELVAANH